MEKIVLEEIKNYFQREIVFIAGSIEITKMTISDFQKFLFEN